MATATHVFELLKTSYPQAKLTVLCKPFVKSLIAHDPHIDEIITDIQAYNKPYQLVVELRGTWNTLLKSFLHKAKYRVGRAEVRVANRGQQLHEIATNAAVIAPMALSVNTALKPRLYFSEADEKNVQAFLMEHEIKKFAILHVGARRVLRQWPLERFAQIANFLQLRLVRIGQWQAFQLLLHLGHNVNAFVAEFVVARSRLLEVVVACLRAGADRQPEQRLAALVFPRAAANRDRLRP